jgi:DNA-directed RNA polymerase specialized sigma24 family protein
MFLAIPVKKNVVRMANYRALERISGRGSNLSAQLGRPEFKKLQLRLMAYCIRLFHELGIGGRDSIISGVGLSAEDFVGEVLADYLLGKIKHHSSKGSLMTVLGTALRNDIIDALRRKSHALEESWVPLEGENDSDGMRSKTVIALREGSAPDILAILDEDAYKGRMREALSGEKDLVEVVDAVLEFNATKPEEMAEIIGTTAAQVQTRKKRLRRRLIAHGLVHVERKKAGS